MFVITDMLFQFIVSMVICFIFFLFWKLGHKGEKL